MAGLLARPHSPWVLWGSGTPTVLHMPNTTKAQLAEQRIVQQMCSPGGPTSRAPLGILAPRRVYLSGFFRKSTTSCSSSLAWSQPATCGEHWWEAMHALAGLTSGKQCTRQLG